MIRIRIKREESGRVDSVSIRGHADYGAYGQDIVCAAVSGIAIGTTHAAKALLNVVIYQDDAKEGKLDLFVPGELDTDRKERVQFLLDAMTVSLHSVADSYGDYVIIHDD
ncbi:ribosomal-processing cysteine protease Prp [Kroppenstedtia pulmonis]|uniref:Ribosomal processing cysteine protease Prp n=1 Tax=Kroppenstedtia pulmonis TaxID=1380685 RepID=A0A7D4B243_9BACL|nr:ribosomal-processing cysteine protease Prp [Kroppenstedtia pulmonis]QKG84106.1 ribosomal-processing cysteine protease Prp [Kroppenstedtia pulmonis]